MQIERLALCNFRAFFGEHEIQLSTTQSANLIVVYAENMRGKTTLLQAIRWVLYGQVEDRYGNAVPILDPKHIEQLLSLDAESGGDFRISVTLDFRHEGIQYRLFRQSQAAGEPTSDSGFVHEKELRRDGIVLAEASVDREVQTILSKDVSQFFLFDGEMLQRYERLLKDPDEANSAVRAAIEAILGVPALKFHNDISEEETKASRRLSSHLKQMEKYADLVRQVDAAENAVRSLKIDRDRFKADLDEATQDKETAELEVKRMGGVERDLKEIQVLERQIDGLDDLIRKNREEIQSLLATSWWVPVAGLLRSRLDEVQKQLTAAVSRQRMEYQANGIEQALTSRVCPVCKGPLGPEQAGKMKDDLIRLKVSLGTADDVPDPVTLERRRTVYQRFADDGAGRELRVREEAVLGALTDKASADSQVRAIRERISDEARGDMQQKVETYHSLVETVRDIQTRLRNASESLQEAEADLAGKRRKVSQAPEADPALKLQVAGLRELADIFEEAVAQFRSRTRERVESDASAIFKELTTEPEYPGLAITEQYGLRLRDRSGKLIPGRSAGAEQIVALALIGGLNRAAIREGPVIMDTNLGRLDRGHRANIVKFLPHLRNQVVLLVHSGELMKDEEIGVPVARKYEIVRKTETQSEIEVVA